MVPSSRGTTHPPQFLEIPLPHSGRAPRTDKSRDQRSTCLPAAVVLPHLLACADATSQWVVRKVASVVFFVPSCTVYRSLVPVLPPEHYTASTEVGYEKYFSYCRTWCLHNGRGRQRGRVAAGNLDRSNEPPTSRSVPQPLPSSP